MNELPGAAKPRRQLKPWHRTPNKPFFSLPTVVVDAVGSDPTSDEEMQGKENTRPGNHDKSENIIEDLLSFVDDMKSKTVESNKTPEEPAIEPLQRPSKLRVPLAPYNRREDNSSSQSIHTAPKPKVGPVSSVPTLAIPALRLGQYQEIPWVDFRQVHVGEVAKQRFVVQNTTDSQATVSLYRVPEGKGFSASLESENDDVESSGLCILQPGASVNISLCWCPLNEGPTKTSVLLKYNQKFTLQATLVGTAVATKAKGRKTGKADAQDGPVSATSTFAMKRAQQIRETNMSHNQSGLDDELNNRPFKARKLDRRMLERPIGIPTKKYANPSKRGTSSDRVPVKENTKPQLRVKPKVTTLAESSSRSRMDTLSQQSMAAKPPVLSSQRAKTAAPKTHSLPTRVLYDARWMEKQEKGFTEWMNYTFNPPENELELKESEKMMASSASGAPTILETSTLANRNQFRVLLQKRKESAVRRAAFKLYHSPEMEKVLFTIDREISTGRLAMRSDRNLHADVGLRESVVELLMGYNPAWLRIGLEVIYGEIISMPSVDPSATVPGAFAGATGPGGAGPKTAKPRKSIFASSVPTTKVSKASTPRNSGTVSNRGTRALRKFIMERLLNDPLIKEQHTGSTTIPSGDRGAKYAAALRRFTLKKFLMLVYFLDQAKQQNLLETVPCLFRNSSSCKSSRDVLVEFCKTYLSGEGDFLRHLSLLGLSVSYKQTYLDEYDYTVSNLAVDLRDGVRMARLLELLTDDKNFALSKQLRVPVISRLQKVHNVDVSLKKLQHLDFDFSGFRGDGLTSKDIVDGHREKTLLFLWKLILLYKINLSIDMEDLGTEIKIIKSKSTFEAVQLSNELDKIDATSGLPGSVVGNSNDDESTTDAADKSGSKEKLRSLLKWCRAICSQYDVKIANFSTSFADGKALCLLIHHYHPQLLKRSEIALTCADLARTKTGLSTQQQVELETWSDLRHPAVNDKEYQAALAGEAANFTLANARAQAIGGIPELVGEYNTSNPPEEKSMITFVTYLCSRLIDSSREVRAAVKIQKSWSQFYRRVLLPRKNMAARRIQRAWYCTSVLRWARRCNLQAKRAATTIQAVARGHLVRLKQCQENDAAFVIQLWYLRACAIRQQQEEVAQQQQIYRSACLIQTFFRICVEEKMRREQVELALMTWAAQVIQFYWRNFVRRQQIREEQALLTIQNAVRTMVQNRRTKQLRHFSAILVQSLFRGFQGRKCAHRRRAAVLRIQSFARAQAHRSACQKAQLAATTIQNSFRRYKQQLNKLSLLHLTKIAAVAATEIQRVYRAHVARRQVQSFRVGIVKCQALVRARQQRSRYICALYAIIRIQAMMKGRIVRARILAGCRAVVILQNRWRKHQQNVRRGAAVLIQSVYRKHQVRQRWQKVQLAARHIRGVWRQYSYRKWQKEYERQIRLTAATKIQNCYRGYLMKKKYEHLVASVVRIQSFARRCRARTLYHTQRAATTLIAAQWRAASARRRFIHAKFASILTQAAWRGYMERSRFLKCKQSAIVIQKTFRCHRQVRLYQQQNYAALKLQATWRGYAQRQLLSIQHFAATILAAWYRGTLVHRRYKNAVLPSIVTLQSHFRMWRCQRHAALQRSSIITIQRLARGRLCRQGLKAQESAALVIQKRFRGHLVRKHLAVLSSAAVIIQRVYRSWFAHQWCVKKNKSAVTIQSVYRGAVVRRKISLSAIFTSSRRIQQWWRQILYAREQEYLLCEAAATEIQRVFRGFVQRESYQEILRATVYIQTWWRLTMAIKSHQVRESTAITIQKQWRRHQEVRKYQQLRCGVIRLQAHWRRRRVMKCLAALETCLQRWQRQFLQEKRVRQAPAAITIQKNYRMMRDHRKYVEAKERRRLEREEAMLNHRQSESARIIQRQMRCHLRREQMQVALRHAIARWNSAAVVIQSVARQFLLRLDAIRAERSVIRIQSFWRGAVLRRQCTRKVQAMRQRIKVVNASAQEHMKIGNRTRSALESLSSGTKLTSVLHSCISLEVATRYSKLCCEQVVAANAIEILYSLIRSCNRSQPHMELLVHALGILTNLAAHTHLQPAIGAPAEAVDVFADLMQMFRDKEVLFLRAVNLLIIVCDVKTAPVVKQLHEDLPKRLNSIRQILSRKWEMEKKMAEKLPNMRSASKTYRSVMAVEKLLQKL